MKTRPSFVGVVFCCSNLTLAGSKPERKAVFG